jgi:hypothetical protein
MDKTANENSSFYELHVKDPYKWTAPGKPDMAFL